MTQIPAHGPTPGAFPRDPTPPVPAAVAVGPHAVAGDAEEVYFAGTPLLRGELGRGFLWMLIGVMFVAGPFVFHFVSNNLWPIWWVTLAAIVLGLILIAVPYFKAKSIRYRITNYRIDVQHGLLSSNIETIELWHVEDLRFHQSLAARMVGMGDITIISKHPTIPVLEMRSLPKARHLFTELEQRVIAVKRLNSVVKVDSGT